MDAKERDATMDPNGMEPAGRETSVIVAKLSMVNRNLRNNC